jgi:hypothetical protein
VAYMAPQNPRAYDLFADCLASIGDQDRAVIELQNAIAYSPNDASTLYNAACVKEKEK